MTSFKIEILFMHKSSSQKKQMNKMVSDGSFRTGAGEKVRWSASKAFLTQVKDKHFMLQILLQLHPVGLG